MFPQQIKRHHVGVSKSTYSRNITLAAAAAHSTTLSQSAVALNRKWCYLVRQRRGLIQLNALVNSFRPFSFCQAQLIPVINTRRPSSYITLPPDLASRRHHIAASRRHCHPRELWHEIFIKARLKHMFAPSRCFGRVVYYRSRRRRWQMVPFLAHLRLIKQPIR